MAGMGIRPVTPELLVAELVERIVALDAAATARVLVDGAVGARELADAVVEPLKVVGRPALRVSARDFLRPRSLRLEYGRDDPEAYYRDWLDAAGLTREVLAPLGPGGSGRYLPTLWDAAADRATRASYVEAPARAVLVLDGALLLGRGLPADLGVHLWMSEGAVARQTPADERWTLPAYRLYDDEARPREVADVVVRYDDPRHPAVLDR
jgi:hypothetical protein